MKERVDRGEADISRGDAILTLLFKMGQEREDSGRIEIRQVEPRYRLVSLSGKKPQEQNYAVAVAVDGMRAGSSKAGKVVRKVFADYGAEQIRKLGFHPRLLAGCGSGETNSP
jgi:hypothetical protein